MLVFLFTGVFLQIAIVLAQYDGPKMNVLKSGYETVSNDNTVEDPVSSSGGDQLGYQGDFETVPGHPLVDPPNLTPPPTPPPHDKEKPQNSLLNPGIKFPPKAPPSDDSPRRYVDPVNKTPPRPSPRIRPGKTIANTRPRTSQPIPKPPLLEGVAPRPLVDPVDLGPPNVPVPGPGRVRPGKGGSTQPQVDPLRNRPLPPPEPPRLQVPPDCSGMLVSSGADDSDSDSSNGNYDLDYPPGENPNARKNRLVKALAALIELQAELLSTITAMRRSANVGSNEFSPSEVKGIADSVRSVVKDLKKMRRRHKF